MKTFGILKWTGAAIVGYWVAVPVLIRFLVIFMGFDFATGLLAGFINHQLASEISYRGLAKKTMMLLLVGAAHMTAKAFNWGLDLGSMVATAYMVNELISVVENCARAGVPVPGVLVQALAKLRKQTSATRADLAGLEDKSSAAGAGE